MSTRVAHVLSGNNWEQLQLMFSLNQVILGRAFAHHLKIYQQRCWNFLFLFIKQ